MRIFALMFFVWSLSLSQSLWAQAGSYYYDAGSNCEFVEVASNVFAVPSSCQSAFNSYFSCSSQQITTNSTYGIDTVSCSVSNIDSFLQSISDTDYLFQAVSAPDYETSSTLTGYIVEQVGDVYIHDMTLSGFHVIYPVFAQGTNSVLGLGHNFDEFIDLYELYKQEIADLNNAGSTTFDETQHFLKSDAFPLTSMDNPFSAKLDNPRYRHFFYFDISQSKTQVIANLTPLLGTSFQLTVYDSRGRIIFKKNSHRRFGDINFRKKLKKGRYFMLIQGGRSHHRYQLDYSIK
ncbi:MAG: hypothetical protein H6621_13030 [Halobacteriovoraceae bacterium]|nr:hypothetical protein [Halobacteriovoraceae bacterium]